MSTQEGSSYREGKRDPTSDNEILRCRYTPCVCVCVLVAQSCPTLCDPMGCSPPGSSVCGISPARILEWVAISFSRGSSWPRDWTQVSCIAGRLFTVWATREENYCQHVRSGMLMAPALSPARSSSQDFQKHRTLVLSNNNLNQRHLLSSFSAERPFKLPTVCFGLLLKG